MLDILNLSKTYRSNQRTVHALEGASVKVSGGEFVAVHGPSGCGKTTLLLAGGGLLRPDGGQVVLDGRDPYLLTPEQRARFRAEKIGFVFQQFHLVPYLSVVDNVLVSALAVPSDTARHRAEELIDHFGLADRARHVPSELSTGERQRVALARALLNCPKLLLADEPTGNLDPDNAEIVLSYLGEFARSGGAVLLVTHDSNAANHAGRTLELRGGKLSGNRQALKKSQ